MKTAIIGAGLYAAALIAYMRELSSTQVVMALDDDESKLGSTVADVRVVGPTDSLRSLQESGIQAVVVAIGDNCRRVDLNRLALESGLCAPGFIHPAASIASSATLSEGCIVLDGAVIQPHAIVSPFCIISSNATLAHHSRLGTGTSLAAGTTVGAGVSLGKEVAVGVGANVMTGVRSIGDRAVVGAGAAVIANVAPGETVVGVPAQRLDRPQA